MKVLIVGATGLIGKVLVPHLRPLKLVRRQPTASDERFWDPAKGELDPSHLENIDAVINLAGANISGFWTAAKKRAILESRLQTTKLLAETMAKLKNPPRLLLNASAVGIYGDRGGEILTERSSPGTGFLAEVCQQWEQATEPASQVGVRVICLRFGPVLFKEGGLLGRLLPLFKLGLGGVIGSGEQYISWIAIEDLVRMVDFALSTPLQGAVNATNPVPVTNREFTKELGKALHRPTLLPVPTFAVKLLGEMGRELLLSSTRAIPEKLQQAGFEFKFPLELALAHTSQS